MKTYTVDLSSSEITNKTVLKRVVLSDATILVYFAVADNFRIIVWRIVKSKTLHARSRKSPQGEKETHVYSSY